MQMLIFRFRFFLFKCIHTVKQPSSYFIAHPTMFPEIPTFQSQSSLEEYLLALQDQANKMKDQAKRAFARQRQFITVPQSEQHDSTTHRNPQAHVTLRDLKRTAQEADLPAQHSVPQLARKRKKRSSHEAKMEESANAPKKPKPTNGQRDLKKQLIESYDPNDKEWGKKAMVEINALWADPVRLGPPKPNAKDPSRLGSKSNFVSGLKSDIIKTLEPLTSDGQIEFNLLSRYEQMQVLNRAKMDAKKRRKEVPEWLAALNIVPANLKDLRLTEEESQNVHDVHMKSQDDLGAPLRVDGDEILRSIVPLLNSNNISSEVIPALVLCTGRRISEILKSGRFYIVEGQDGNGYLCMFSGQLKRKSREDKPYVIHLLAPFNLISSALQRAREYVHLREEKNKLNGKKTTPASSFNSTVLKGVKKLFGGKEWTNRSLRSLYADICRQVFGKDQRSSKFRQTILGHSDPKNQMNYEMAVADNVTGPYVVRPGAEKPVTPAVVDTEYAEAVWVAPNKPERKKVEAIKKLMKQGKKVTIEAVKAAGGTLDVIKRVIENNKAIIDRYNSSF